VRDELEQTELRDKETCCVLAAAAVSKDDVAPCSRKPRLQEHIAPGLGLRGS
jgi:hypothetical protein